MRQIDQLEDVNNPNINLIRDEAMKEAKVEEDPGRADHHTKQTELPPSGSGPRDPTRGTTAGTAAEGPTTTEDTPHGRHPPQIWQPKPANNPT